MPSTIRHSRIPVNRYVSPPTEASACQSIDIIPSPEPPISRFASTDVIADRPSYVCQGRGLTMIDNAPPDSR